MNEIDWYRDPQWYAIIVALLLGVAGIFQDWIRNLFRKPKLKVSIRKEPPDCLRAVFKKQGTGEFVCDSYFMRFKVKNTGSQQLEEVEAMAFEVEEKEEGGSYIKIQEFLPMSLNWSHYGVPIMQKILPDFFRYCDLGHIRQSDENFLQQFEKQKSSNVIFVLSLHQAPFIGCHILEPGEYRLKLKIGANNHKPILKTFHLKFADEWLDDEKEMFDKNIEINEI